MDREKGENVNKRIYECIRNARKMLDVSIKEANKNFEESVTDARSKFEESITSSKLILITSVAIAKKALDESIKEAEIHLEESDKDQRSLAAAGTKGISNKISRSTDPKHQKSTNVLSHKLKKDFNKKVISIRYPTNKNVNNRDLENSIPISFQQTPVIGLSSQGNNSNVSNLNVTTLGLSESMSFIQNNGISSSSNKTIVECATTQEGTNFQSSSCALQKNKSEEEGFSDLVEIKIELEESGDEGSFAVSNTNQIGVQPEDCGRGDAKDQNIDMTLSDSVSGCFEEQLETETNQDQFECHACGIKFVTKYLLDKHYCRPYLRIKPKPVKNSDAEGNETVINLNFKCPLCENATFSSLKKLDLHKKRAHETIFQTQWKCDICEKFLSNKGSLSRHLKMHNGLRPYTCAVCGKSFSQKYHYQYHLNTHSKPFKCEVCGKSFSQRPSLNNHLYQHTLREDILARRNFGE
ncbi:gastrula zinc finger protein xFG20-1-like [Clytia hemisphaerica]|uniref:C2H2-type domain-containing protein n=1 Tax=Clytia hemisphaerica TaxID=252671 RepID=A0A7M5VFV1_9CNID